MGKQILKGWVTIDNSPGAETNEPYLIKEKVKEIEYHHEHRALNMLICNALHALGAEDTTTEEEYDGGISSKYHLDNAEIQILSAVERTSLEDITKNIVLKSMGVLDFEEGWYGWSSFTIEGFETNTFKLGGHDILNIVRQLEGKYVYITIDKV